MRIPYVKNSGNIEKNKINIVKLNKDDVPKVRYEPDVDFDDEKSVSRYVKQLKSMMRSSREYKKLMKFLKTKLDLNSCFFLPNVRQIKNAKISIEMHHVGFTAEDIIHTVLKKRIKEEEDVLAQNVLSEIMLLHYKGMLSLCPLSATMHELIHAEDSQLFIPLQLSSFGDMRLFFDEYEKYMKRDLKKKFETYKVMSHAFDKIEEIIPDYLDLSIIYYEVEGIEIPRMDKILELIK